MVRKADVIFIVAVLFCIYTARFILRADDVEETGAVVYVTNTVTITNTVISRADCEAIHGHCWIASDEILYSYPPPRRIKCKHCGFCTTERLQ